MFSIGESMKLLKGFIVLLLSYSVGSQAAVFGQINDLTYMLNSGILVKAVSKEYCTCKFMYNMDLKECLERNHLPEQLLGMIRVEVDEEKMTVRVRPSRKTFMLLGGRTEASSRFIKFGKNYGCQVYHEGKINFQDGL
jgi:hypothetical protein